MKNSADRRMVPALMAAILCSCCAATDAVLLANRAGIGDFAHGLSVGVPLGTAIVLAGVALHRMRMDRNPL